MTFTLLNHWTRKHWVYSLFGLLLLLAIYRCGDIGFDEETDVRIFVDGLNNLTVPASIRGGESVTLTAEFDRITTERSIIVWGDRGLGGSFSNVNSPVTRWTPPTDFNGEATIIVGVFERCFAATDPNCTNEPQGLLLNTKVTKIPVSTFTAYDFFLGQGVRFDLDSRVVTSFEDAQVGDDGPEVVILEFFNFHYILEFISFVTHTFSLNLIGPDGGIRSTFEGLLHPQFSNVNVTVAEQTEEITAGELNRGTWIYELLVDGRLFDIQNDPNIGPLSKTFTAIREGDDLPFFSSTVIANAGGNRTVAVGLSIVLDGSGSSGPSNRPLFFKWTILDQPERSRPTFTNIDTLFPTFKAGATSNDEGTYVIQLVVTDGINTSRPDIVTINVIKDIPIARIADGDRTVTSGNPVTLDGSGSSDPNNDPLTFTWSIDSQPSGSMVSLNNTSSQIASFTPIVDGEYIITLKVEDDDGNIDTDTVTITAVPVP